MTGQLRIIRTDDFTGGLNLRSDPFQLADNESPDLLNVDVDPLGGFSIRGGFQRAHASAIGSLTSSTFQPRNVLSWDNKTNSQMLLATNAKVFYWNGTAWADTGVAYTNDDGACMTPWTSAAGSFVYIAEGTAETQMSKWNGTTLTLLTASATGQWQDSLSSPTGTHCPRADHVTSHIDRLWVAGTIENGTAYPNRVRWSHPNFAESWREVDYIDIVAGGNGITALVPYGDALFVFKRDSVHAIYGYDTDSFQVVKLSDSLGTASHRSVLATEFGLFFFDWPDGLFRWNGQEFEDLFVKLRPVLPQVLIKTTQANKIWVGHTNNRVWVSVPIALEDYPTHNFVYDPSTGAWVQYRTSDSFALVGVADWLTPTGLRKFYGFHAKQPYMVEVDAAQATDNFVGTQDNFSSYYVTRWQDGALISAKKMWRRPDFIVRQGDVDVTLGLEVRHDWEEALPRRSQQLTIDAAGGASFWGVMEWGVGSWGGGASGAQHERGSNLGLARAIQLKISGPGGLPWGVNSITYKFQQRRIR